MGVIIAGVARPKVGYYMPFVLTSGILITIGGALMFRIKSTTSTSNIYGYSMFIGFGSGLTIQLGYAVGPLKVVMNCEWGPTMIPDVIGFMNTAQLGSVVHALAISGTIFQNLAFRNLKNSLGQMGFTDAQLHQTISGLKSDVLVNETVTVKELAVDSIISAMGHVWILIIVSGCTLVISSLFLKREKLNFSAK